MWGHQNQPQIARADPISSGMVSLDSCDSKGIDLTSPGGLETIPVEIVGLGVQRNFWPSWIGVAALGSSIPNYWFGGKIDL